MASDSSQSGALLLEARNSAQALQSVIQDQGQIIDRDNVFQDALKCLAELHMSTESRDCNEVQELNSSIVALLTRTEGKPLDGTRKVHDDSVAKLLKIHGTPRTSDASSMLDALMFIFSRTLDDSGNLAVDPKANLSLLYESGDFQLPRDSTLGGSFEALDFQDFKKHDTIAKAPNTAVAILFCFMENHNKLAIELRKQDELQGDEEQIFNAARTINCLQFQNVIIEDVLHGLTLPLVDPWAKLDIDTSNDKQASRDDEARLLYEMFTFESPGGVPSPPPHEVIHNALHESTKIYEIYKNPHCDGILAWLKDRSIVTFNEYRKFLGLNPLSDFNHWTENPKVIESYDSMDSVELLPGLYFERSFPGSGFNLGYTHTYALFIDIVKILRQDPIRKEMKAEEMGV
ncbi:hypothetical protein BDN72DRAFT_492400 [Pluteus cervinus]|uniref:Uncharacterized protein n=1 Tax=Pluteus cervinus TaxID=181527 RepID=A0ACD3B1A6_9AGAR|nr:hypothetical protein BDN72DRAFT_492400 [Pluteus cervinus]